MSGPVLRLDSAVFRANIAAVRQRISPSELMVIVKDDAYGHGLAWAVREAAAAGVEWVGSYDIAGGLAVRRQAGPAVRVFAWATSSDDEIDQALGGGIDLGVGTAEYLDRIIVRAAATGSIARVHLKIDSGLHRNGVRPEHWADVVRTARSAEARGEIELVGVWSHIAEASDAEDDDAQEVFLRAADAVDTTGAAAAWRHLTASAASWWRPELRGTLSRIGAFCYGVRSADGPELDGIRPAATLAAPVIGIDGDDAVIAIGSFDGIPSTLAGAPVGTPAGSRTLRRIDEATAHVAGWPGMSVGDEVLVFGAGVCGEESATSLAERIDTVGEEILTRLSPRIPRVEL